MSDAPERPTFRTKTGVCFVEGDTLVIERKGARGAAANAVVGMSVRRVVVIYVIAATTLGYFGYRLVEQGRPFAGAFFVAAGVFLAVTAIRSRNYSAIPEIPLASITRIVAHKPKPPLTRGYFEVHFTDGQQMKKRLVILPGTMDGGVEEYDVAMKVLLATGKLSPD